MDISDIIRRAGGPVKIARSTGLRSHATVIGWKRVPDVHVRTVARMAGLTPHDLRPDVFGPDEMCERGAA